VIPSDHSSIMLFEPAFVPQMGAARQRSNYASSPVRLASSSSVSGRFAGHSLPGFF
jgi:hypothetical protein